MKFCNVLLVIIFPKSEEKFIKAKICKLPVNSKNCSVLLCICGSVNLNICSRLGIYKFICGSYIM